jgi:hypothetical protein
MVGRADEDGIDRFILQHFPVVTERGAGPFVGVLDPLFGCGKVTVVYVAYGDGVFYQFSQVAGALVAYPDEAHAYELARIHAAGRSCSVEEKVWSGHTQHRSEQDRAAAAQKLAARKSGLRGERD